MQKWDPSVKRAARQLLGMLATSCVVLAGATFAGASDGLLLALAPATAGVCTLFAVLRVLPMMDAADRRRAQEAADGAPMGRHGSAAPGSAPAATARPLGDGGASRALR
ncbi:MAG TPA: hypothetical protein VN238_12275 [Solirubrobacteraceae bacterium]|nr:hypothetical protein [Solirubrobacteraceae bacterium]